jgi:hypothetical protein
MLAAGVRGKEESVPSEPWIPGLWDVLRDLVAIVKSMPRELEGWLVWRLDALSVADRDRRLGCLPAFVILHEWGSA